MNLSLEKINKNLLLVALFSLIYRKGSFSTSFIPKPFEIFFLVIVILTSVYLIKNHKIKDFFLSIPRNILIAVGALLSSIFIGWIIGTIFIGIPITFNTILEFGTFAVGMSTFLLVLFYTKNDDMYAKWYLWALLVPNVMMLYFFFCNGVVAYFGIPNNGFLDYTLNPNVLSKILLIPAIFFISKSLFGLKDRKWIHMMGYMFISAIYVGLVFWTVSRGAMLSMGLGAFVVFLAFSLDQFNWKKMLSALLVVVGIFCLGFVMVPGGTKQAISIKIGHTVDTVQKLDETKIALVAPTPSVPFHIYEPRLIIWSFFPKYAFMHPLGVGPNTHADFNVFDKNGAKVDLGPDNTYLQIWVWGGLLGIGSFLYILWSAFVVLWVRLKKDFDQRTLALIGILFALSVVVFFDASLSFFWFFIILALSLQRNEDSSRKHTSANL